MWKVTNRRLRPPLLPSLYPFDAVYLINLDRRVDRLANARGQLERIGLWSHTERVPAIDLGQPGTTLDTVLSKVAEHGCALTALATKRLQLPPESKLFGMDLTPGAVGCALSHRAVWQKIVNRKDRVALILEDDVEFSPKMRSTFMDRWSRVPSDWGLVYLGGLDLLASGKPPRPFVADGVRYAFDGHRELTAYVVHADTARRCLELTRTMQWQVDTHICSIFRDSPEAQDRFICDPMSYVLQPSLAIQLAKFGTDVQKSAEQSPAMTDAKRRMNEFVGGKTSVR